MKEIISKIEDISFVSYKELYENKEIIKKLYMLKDEDIKKIYKWYFYYQLCMLKPYYKDSIWLWLNNDLDIEEVNKRYNEFNEIRNKISANLTYNH